MYGSAAGGAKENISRGGLVLFRSLGARDEVVCSPDTPHGCRCRESLASAVRRCSREARGPPAYLTRFMMSFKYLKAEICCTTLSRTFDGLSFAKVWLSFRRVGIQGRDGSQLSFVRVSPPTPFLWDLVITVLLASERWRCATEMKNDQSVSRLDRESPCVSSNPLLARKRPNP